MAKPASNTKPHHVTGKRLLMLAIILLLLYVVVPQLGNFSNSLGIIERANISWLVLAAITTTLTYAAAAGSYYFLALKKLKFLRTFAVEGASAFTNRLLPAGIGGISLNVAYLKKARHNNTEAGVVVGVNDVLGLIANVIIIVLIAATGQRLALNIHVPFWIYYLVGAIVAAGILVFILVKSWRREGRKLLANIIKNLMRYSARPHRLVGALICAVALTLLYAVALYFCMRAIGYQLDVGKVFLVFIGSVVVATATPTPGGLIGAEAAITAGFTAYGLPASDGLAIALIYRLITYWLPLIAGFAVFEIINHKQII